MLRSATTATASLPRLGQATESNRTGSSERAELVPIDAVVGAEATRLYEDAQALLKQIIDEKWLSANGVIGFWEAQRTAPDTVQVSQPQQTIKLEFLRQQAKKASGQANHSLADWITPAETGTDYLGAFSVTIQGIEPHLKRFEAAHDDYRKIMLQALADRLAEAFAEYLHEQVRIKEWGYQPNEQLSNDELIRESYMGIRPAPGYPACPDHTEKIKLFHLLGGESTTGIHLTESLAMYPAASVCGWYLAHPESRYFGVGKISEDQLNDYALRKGWTIDEALQWLRPVVE